MIFKHRFLQRDWSFELTKIDAKGRPCFKITDRNGRVLAEDFPCNEDEIYIIGGELSSFL